MKAYQVYAVPVGDGQWHGACRCGCLDGDPRMVLRQSERPACRDAAIMAEHPVFVGNDPVTLGYN